MQNFNEKHPQVIENVGMQMQNLRRKYPQIQEKARCRCNLKREKTMHSSELESGLPDKAEQECIVFFLLGGCRELNT